MAMVLTKTTDGSLVVLGEDGSVPVIAFLESDGGVSMASVGIVRSWMRVSRATKPLLKSVVGWVGLGLGWGGLASLEQDAEGDDDGEDGHHDGKETEGVVRCPGHDDGDLPIVN